MDLEFLKKIKEKSEEDWVWKHSDWICIPNITLNQKEVAKEITSREVFVRNNFGDEFFKELMAESIANEIDKNWDIENIQLNTYVLRSILVNSLNFDIPEWKIDNSSRFIREKAAVQATLTLLNDKEKFDVNKLCKIHSLLKNPSEDINWGKIRKNDIHIRGEFYENEPKIVYIGPPADQVCKLIDKFFEWWDKSRKSLPRPIGAALAHLYLVAIHPFENGNGRMARMVTDKYMIENNDEHTTYRPYSISFEISKNKGKYYDTLYEYSKNGNLNPYLNYMLECHKNAVKKAERRAFFLKDLKNKFGKAWDIFTREERDILRFYSCNFDNNIFGNVNKYKNDFPNLLKVFDNLVSRNIIVNDKINFECIEKINKDIVERDHSKDLLQKQAENIITENSDVIKDFNDLCNDQNVVDSLCLDTDDGRMSIDINSNHTEKRKKNIKFICENTKKYTNEELLNLIMNVLEKSNQKITPNKNENHKKITNNKKHIKM